MTMDMSVGAIRYLPYDTVRPDPNQPRKNFDDEALAELASSIEHNGLLQPPTVRKVDDGYLIIAGERRFRAVGKLGWDKIPCLVRQVSDKEHIRLQATENMLREDLNPIEVGRMIKQLTDGGFDSREIYKITGVHYAQQGQRMALLGLRPDISHLVATDQLNATLASALAVLNPSNQSRALKAIHNRGLGVTEARVLCGLMEQEEKSVGFEFGDEPEPEAPVPATTPKERRSTRDVWEDSFGSLARNLRSMQKLEQESPGALAEVFSHDAELVYKKMDLALLELNRLIRLFKESRVHAAMQEAKT